jgi:hypothetical protein
MPGCYFGEGTVTRTPWIGVAVSFALHLLAGAAMYASTGEPEPVSAGEPFAIDVEIAPVPDVAEPLPPEEAFAQARPEEVLVPLEPPKPEPEPEPEPEPADIPRDAGVDAPPPPPAPTDAGAIAASTDRQVTGDAGAVHPERDGGAVEPKDGGVGVDQLAQGAQASAGTAANLLAFVPDKHVVTVLLRFDRLRGTEWATVAQQVLAVMPDYETLVADPDSVVTDLFDLVAMSSPKPADPTKTLLAVKAKVPIADLRDFLDEPGAPVTWSRVTGGVLGTRGKGKRVIRGDPRVFLAPFGQWMVLARPRDLSGLLDAADGPLDGAAADTAKLPAWLARLPDIEGESGLKDGPALMMTLGPRAKTWDVPDVGLGVTSLPAPERMTLSLEIDPQGFQVKGHLKFASEDDAVTFVERTEAAREAALESAAHALVLKRAKVWNAVKGLSLVRTDRRVSYSTSLSVADARVMTAAGILLVAEYFAAAQAEAEAADKAGK